MEIVFLLVGLVIGGAVAYFILKAKSEGGNAALNEKIKLLETNIAELKNDVNAERANAGQTGKQLASALTENENLKSKLSEQRTEMQGLQEKFHKEFENLANKILDEKSHKFTEQNKNNLDIILNPLKERIKAFEEKVEKTYHAENAERITLKTEIKNLVELNKQISEEANNLATALKGDTKRQGNWGELVLEKILERSGLVKDVEYKVQAHTTNIEGDKIRPDVVIMLPDDKHIIVDSKVSLVAYDAYVNAVNEEDRPRFLKAHIDSVRSHIKLLGDKNYQTAVGLNTPDFVLLFMPIESAFSLALQNDGEMFNYAWDKKIVIVSPTTTLATLRTIASMWKQERQTRNALQIADEGGKLYDKFVGFTEDLIKVGKTMEDSKKAYSEAMNKLVDGTGNLVRRAEKMKELGAKTTKQLPQNLLDRAD